MIYLERVRRRLREHLVAAYSRAEVKRLFDTHEFTPCALSDFGDRGAIVDAYLLQVDWRRKGDSERLFPVAFDVFTALRSRAREQPRYGTKSRAVFRAILEGLRSDGAELLSTRVGWLASPAATAGVGSSDRNDSRQREHASSNVLPQSRAATTPVELLIITALTEENQVVTSLVERFGLNERPGSDYSVYAITCADRCEKRVAIASAHGQGDALGVFAAPLLRELRPRKVALVGIAAAVDLGEVNLGDVPFASEVLSYSDIAVSRGTLTFRTAGFPADPEMERVIGRLRTSVIAYRRWQRACVTSIRKVVRDVNQLRSRKVIVPDDIATPHLVVGPVAGGPFLLRDRSFRDALRSTPGRLKLGRIRVAHPVHPKLLSTEMEAHGFMRAARQEGVPASVLKGISDLGDAGKGQLEARMGGFYRAFACANACLALFHSLELGVLRRR